MEKFGIFDPLGRYGSLFLHISSVPTFHNLSKQNEVKTMFATGETVGLAEWIIADTCLVFPYLQKGLLFSVEYSRTIFLFSKTEISSTVSETFHSIFANFSNVLPSTLQEVLNDRFQRDPS